MKYLSSMLFTLILTLVLTVASVAQQGAPRRALANRPNRGQQWNSADRPMWRIPNLKDEQREQIRQIHLDAQKQMMDLQNQLNEKRAHLRTLTTGSNPDTKAATQVIEEIGDLRTQLMEHRLQTHMKVRKLLTDEQKTAFDTMGPFNGRRNFAGMRPGGQRGTGFCRW